MIRVQITDDHRLFVDGIEKIINESGFAVVVGKSYTVKGCLTMLEEIQADVLLLDIKLPDGNGIDLCSEILNLYPNIKILAVTSFAEYSIVSRMLESGALGYVLKNAMSEEILEGIEKVSKGEKYYCDDVDIILKKTSNQETVLTSRERKLLELIAEGYISSEIAEKMFLSTETINSYRKNLLFKMQAKNTAVLVKNFVEQNVV